MEDDLAFIRKEAVHVELEAVAVEQAPEVTEEIGEEPKVNPVAAIVNGVEITEAQVAEIVEPELKKMEAQFKARPGSGGDIEAAKKQFRGQVLESIVMENLIGQEMKKANIVVSEDDVNDMINEIVTQNNLTVEKLKEILATRGMDFEKWKQQQKLSKGLEALAMSQPGISFDVNDAETLAFYNSNKQRFESPEKVRASHILIKPDTSDPNVDPNQADALALVKIEGLLKQIKENDANFAELAKQHSACPSGKMGGGDLNFFGRGQMVPEFEKAVFETQPGQITDIVKTQFGYHIIKVTDHQDATVTSFEQV